MLTLYTGTQSPNPSYIHTPLIEICKAQNQAALKQAAKQVEQYNYLLFTSRYAVQHWAEHCNISQLRAKPIIVSIGNSTTQALQLSGAQNIEQVEHDNSYGVAQWFAKQPRGRVLIPRSNLALPIIPNKLTELNFSVDTVIAYENRMPQQPHKVDLNTIERIIFTSPSTINNFIKLYGTLPLSKQLIARGIVTQQHLNNIIEKQIKNII